ncbi:nucleotidyltransferase substrate binding protein [Algoriphagus yeomjeoni]|uniref:nucleotidyltransferase substrate binding protein n=1 Tax=Algoriphagus yeomjeoni TaxID=291403 RepID=UPI003CE54AF3
MTSTMTNDDIRWKQRFSNFNKAMNHLENALQITNPDIVQKAGIIQFFEMSFELAWNVVKDYLEEQGFVDIKSPRSALKKAFEMNILENGHDWMDLLQDRNLTAHTYDEQKASDMEKLIDHKYFPILKALQLSFNQKLDEE